MAHIVIMGAGIGGMPAACEMRATLPKEHRIKVLSTVDYFQFTRPIPGSRWAGVTVIL